MKILLVYPSEHAISITPQAMVNVEPLGLEYLAASVPDHDVDIYDMKIEKDIKRKLLDFAPDVVGITGTVIHVHEMHRILHIAKQIDPHVKTIVGGPHATLLPQDFHVPFIDFIILGQNTDAFANVIRAIERKHNFADISGIVINDGTRQRFTKAFEIMNLDHLPIPNRKLVKKYRKNYFHLAWDDVALAITSTGCFGTCNFCACRRLAEGKFLQRDPELVVRELGEIEEKTIYFGDDNFLCDPNRAIRLYEHIKRSGIKKQYYFLSRSDLIAGNPHIIEKWAEIGLQKVFIGLEAVRDEELDAVGKNISTRVNNEAIHILHQNSVDIVGGFVIRPDYEKSDFDRILEYMNCMKIFWFQFTVLTPVPGTPFYDSSKDDLISRDYRLFDFCHSMWATKLPSKEFYREMSSLYAKAGSPLRLLEFRPKVSPLRFNTVKRSLKMLPNYFAIRNAHKHIPPS